MLSSGSQNKIFVVMYFSSGSSIFSGPSAAASSIATTAIQRSRSVTTPTGFRSFSLSTTGTIPVSTRFMISAATWAVSDGIQQTGFRVITWFIRIIPSHFSIKNLIADRLPNPSVGAVPAMRLSISGLPAFITQELPLPPRLISSPLLSRPARARPPHRLHHPRDQPPKHQPDDRQEEQDKRGEKNDIYYTHFKMPQLPNRLPVNNPLTHSNASSAPGRML